jgi:hypothetical protein
MTPENLIPRIAVQCFQLVQKIYDHYKQGQPFATRDLDATWSYLRAIYDKLMLPLGGHIRGRGMGTEHPQRYGTADKHCFIVTPIPRVEQGMDDFFDVDPMLRLVNGDGVEYYTEMPVMTDRPISTFEWGRQEVYSTFVTDGAKIYTLLEDLGYVTKSAVTELVSSVDLYERLVSLVKTSDRVVYKYKLHKELPQWIDDVTYFQNL